MADRENPRSSKNGDRVLARGEVVERLGPISVPGEVTVTESSVSFTPSGVDGKVVLGSWMVPIEHIDQFLEEDSEVIRVTSSDGTHRLGGPLAHPMLELLRSLKEGGEELPELIMLAVAGAVEINGLLSARGDVLITSKSVSFHPERLERRVFGDRQALDVPFEDIDGFELISGGRLQLKTGGRTVRFVGNSVPRIYSALVSLRERGLDSSDGGGEATPMVFSAVEAGGQFSHPGTLCVGRTGISFIPTGRLDRFLERAEPQNFPLEEVRAIRVAGLVNSRLEIIADGGELMISCDQPTSRLFEVSRWIADHNSTPTWSGGVVGRSWGEPSPAEGEVKEQIDKVLATEAQHLLLPSTPLLFSLAVLYEEEEAQMGWLAYTEDRLHWLPRGALQPVRMSLSGSAVVLRDGPQRSVHLRMGASGEFLWLVGDGNISSVLREAVDRAANRPSVVTNLELGAIKGADRRHTYRVPAVPGFDSGLSFHREIEGLVLPLKAEVVNLSLHGVGVRLLAAPKVGDEFLVQIARGDESSELRASVIHCRALGDSGTWYAGCVFKGSWGAIERITRAPWLSLQQARRNQWRKNSETEA